MKHGFFTITVQILAAILVLILTVASVKLIYATPQRPLPRHLNP